MQSSIVSGVSFSVYLPLKKSYRVAQLADNPPKLLCTDKASLTWQRGSHNNLDSLDTYLDLTRQGQWPQLHVSLQDNLQQTISTEMTMSRIGRQITDSLGVIIVGFCIILLEIKSIALLFEAFCFPVLQIGNTTGKMPHKKTHQYPGFIVMFYNITLHSVSHAVDGTVNDSLLEHAGTLLAIHRKSRSSRAAPTLLQSNTESTGLQCQEHMTPCCGSRP